MGIGESIKKGFGTANKSTSLILLLFVFSLIFNLISVFMTPPQAVAPATAPPPAPGLIVAGIIFIFMSIYFQAGSMGFLRDLLKSGSASLVNFSSTGSKYYVRLLLLGIVVSLVIAVFVLLAALATAFLTGNLAALGVALAIFFGALGLYFVIMLFLSPYVAVVDDKGVAESLKLSMKLVKKNVLPLLGVALLLILIGFGIGLILGVVLAGLSFLIKVGMVSQVVFAFFSSLMNAYLGVVVTAAFMAFYLALPDRNNT
jgi:hypothetical protein